MNNKDTYWLTHDTNAKDDPKCVMMIEQFGPEAYGIFWILIEILREQADFCYPLALVPSIARKYNTTKDKVMAVITGYGLFEVRDERFFYSRSLINRTLEWKEKRDHKRAVAIKAALASWEKRREKEVSLPESTDNQKDDKSLVNANAMQTQCGCNANADADAMLINIINNINKDNSSSFHSELSPTLSETEPQPSPAGPKILSRKNCRQVADFWNSTIDALGSTLPKVKAEALSDARCDKIRVRWGEFSKLGDPVEVCRELFRKAAGSKFLQGDNGNGWKASFDWLMANGKNWVKVIEGNYDDHAAGGGKSKGERMWENVRKNLEVLPFNDDGTVNI